MVGCGDGDDGGAVTSRNSSRPGMVEVVQAICTPKYYGGQLPSCTGEPHSADAPIGCLESVLAVVGGASCASTARNSAYTVTRPAARAARAFRNSAMILYT